MKQKSCHRLIFKLHSKQLKAAKLDFHMGIVEAMLEYPECVVALSESQALRFIDEIRGVADRNEQARIIKNKIKREKRKERTAQTGKEIAELYRSLYEIQYIADYVCIIMDSEKDYDLLNKKGFFINGRKFRRFLGTNGGIKNSTIVYISEDIYPEMKSRLDNGRDMSKEFVPAKLEAYQALVCSGSTPIPQPNGIIVVQDCITHFLDNVITIDDSKTEEPELLYVDGYEVERNNSDGFGLMLPSYSRTVNAYLGGNPEETISGMNSRNAWAKGMIYTFDFVDFAEKVAGTFEIADAWGDKRDIRDAEVILTVSMLKLWDSYSSWEDYQANCVKNHYELSTPKITPDKLENVRTTNYQFLQSYELTDEELYQLCLPTITELKNVLGMDYRTSLVFMGGLGLDEYAIYDETVSIYIRALMANSQAINDMFIRRKIWNMICKKVEAAKRGCINVNANYAMILGDPYALAQSMFGLEVTGLLKRGEIYHKYWSEKGAVEVCCFRAPMTW